MRLAMIGALGFLTACASGVPGVHVTEDARATAHCTYVGLVSSLRSMGDDQAVREMQAQVHDRGGDTLLLAPIGGSEGLAAHGEAYRCGHAVPPPQ